MNLQALSRSCPLGANLFNLNTTTQKVYPIQHVTKRQFVGSSINCSKETCEPTEKNTQKPNLRNVGRVDKRTVSILVASVVFMCALMYPQIFKPLFGIGEKQAKIRDKAGLDASKTRPTNMPEWSSPFGPKGDKEE